MKIKCCDTSIFPRFGAVSKASPFAKVEYEGQTIYIPLSDPPSLQVKTSVQTMASSTLAEVFPWKKEIKKSKDSGISMEAFQNLLGILNASPKGIEKSQIVVEKNVKWQNLWDDMFFKRATLKTPAEALKPEEAIKNDKLPTEERSTTVKYFTLGQEEKPFYPTSQAYKVILLEKGGELNGQVYRLDNAESFGYSRLQDPENKKKLKSTLVYRHSPRTMGKLNVVGSGKLVNTIETFFKNIKKLK